MTRRNDTDVVSLHWLPVLLLVLFLVETGQAQTPDVEVTKWNGTRMTGSIQGISRRSSSTVIQFKNAGDSDPVSLRNLIRIQFPAQPLSGSPAPIEVRLQSGSRLRGQLLDKKSQNGFWLQSIDLQSTIELKFLRHQIRSIEYLRQQTQANITRQSDRHQDVLYKMNGDVFFGFLQKLNAKHVKFEEQRLGEETVPHKQIYAIDLASTSSPPEPPDAPFVEVHTRNGSVFVGQLQKLKKEHISIQGFTDVTWKIPLSKITSILVKNGRTTFLSDLSPAYVIQEDRWLANSQKDPSDLPFPFHYQEDESIPKMHGETDPIQINGKTYPKGLSCYPYTLLVYKLDQQYNQFRATIGLDDRAGHPERDPSVHFRVYVDQQKKPDSSSNASTTKRPVSSSKTIPVIKRYDTEKAFRNGNQGRAMRFSDSPRKLSISVDNHQYIFLEVDHGTGYLEYADWGNARVIRSP